MVNQTTPAGITVSAIQSPRVNVGVTTPQLNVNPLFQGMAQGRANFQQKENVRQVNQKLAMDFIKQQNEMFQNATGKIGESSMFGLKFDPTTAKGREMQLRLEGLQNKAQENIFRSISGGNTAGKFDPISASRESQRELTKLRESVLSDPELFEVYVAQRDRNNMLDQAAQLEKDGYVVDKLGMTNALSNTEAFLNDASGKVRYSPEVLNVSNYVYDRKEMNGQIDDLLTAAIGETEIAELVSSNTLEGFEDTNTLLEYKRKMQNGKKKAAQMVADRLENDPRMMGYLRAQGIVNPKVVLAERLESLLGDENSLVSIEGLDDLNRQITQQQKDAAAMDREKEKTGREEEKTKRKGITSMYSSTSTSTYTKFDESTEKGRALNDLGTKIDNLSDTFGVDSQAVRDIAKFLEENPRYNSSDVSIDDEGNIAIIKPNSEGEPNVIRSFGKGSAKYKSNDRAFSAAANKEVFEDFSQMDAGAMGVYSGAIQGYEQRPTNGASSKEDETGIYSYRLEPDGNATYGTHQMYGGTWNGFVRSLNKELELGLTEDEIKELDATKGAATKDNVLNFIENLSGNIGEAEFADLEQRYLMGKRWFPAIKEAERRFGTDLSNQVRTFMADAANQHGNAAGEYLDFVEQDLEERGADPKNEQELLRSMYNARIKYLDKYDGNVTDTEKQKIIDNRYTDLYNKLSNDLATRGPDFSRGNVSTIGTATAGATTQLSSPEQAVEQQFQQFSQRVASTPGGFVPLQDAANFLDFATQVNPATGIPNKPIVASIINTNEGLANNMEEIARLRSVEGADKVKATRKANELQKELEASPEYRRSVKALATPDKYLAEATRPDVETLIDKKRISVGDPTDGVNEYIEIEPIPSGGYAIGYYKTYSMGPFSSGNVVTINQGTAATKDNIAGFLAANVPEKYVDQAFEAFQQDGGQQVGAQTPVQTPLQTPQQGPQQAPPPDDYREAIDQFVNDGNLAQPRYEIQLPENENFERRATFERMGDDTYTVKMKNKDGSVTELNADNPEDLKKLIEDNLGTGTSERSVNDILGY